MPKRSPYAILGIAPSASGREIRTAYHALALRHHPDVASSTEVGPFIEVQQAYELLSDPASRRAWDQAHSPDSERRHESRFTSPVVDLASDLADTANRLFFDLVLTPDEAARGGRFSFTIPLRTVGGERVEPELHVLVPPGAHDGQCATLPLAHLGFPRGQVTVTVRLE